MYDKLMPKLQTGIAHFVFKNAKGEARTAFGTLKPELIPQRGESAVFKLKAALEEQRDILITLIEEGEIEPKLIEAAKLKVEAALSIFDYKPSERKQTEGVQVYYDLGSQGWRSFKIDQLLEVCLD